MLLKRVGGGGVGCIREGSPVRENICEIFSQDIPGKWGWGMGKESGGVWKD